MQKISPFNQWIHESTELDPERLIELGLFDGPVLEWWITASQSTWFDSTRPAIGKMWFFPDCLDRENSHDFTIYPSSFEDQAAVDEILRGWFYREAADGAALVTWCSRHLRELIDRYPPHWSQVWSGPVWCKCLNNGEWRLVEPAN
jgi:hypothetical protein